MKEKIREILWEFVSGDITDSEAIDKILSISIGAASRSLSFKEQMKQGIIPRVSQMAEKEKEHLNWLIDNNAPKDMIETQRYLIHFRQRHKEYIEYADGL